MNVIDQLKKLGVKEGDIVAQGQFRWEVKYDSTRFLCHYLEGTTPVWCCHNSLPGLEKVDKCQTKK